jgi:hypothetical protein
MTAFADELTVRGGALYARASVVRPSFGVVFAVLSAISGIRDPTCGGGSPRRFVAVT